MSQNAMIVGYAAKSGGWQTNAAIPVSGWATEINSSQMRLGVVADPDLGVWTVRIENTSGTTLTGTLSLLLAGQKAFRSPCRLVTALGESQGRVVSKPAGEVLGQRFDSKRPDAPIRDAFAFSVAAGDVATWTAKVAPCDPADLDGDGSVGQSDLGILLGSWGSASLAPDLDASGAVGADDLALFLAEWPE
jgi:hypothetical protein